jgi:hypothetical protein
VIGCGGGAAVVSCHLKCTDLTTYFLHNSNIILFTEHHSRSNEPVWHETRVFVLCQTVGQTHLAEYAATKCQTTSDDKGHHSTGKVDGPFAETSPRYI